jgi:adenosylhomocysteinase
MDYEPSRYKVRSLSLAERGLKRIQWAEEHMPVVMKIMERYRGAKPFCGLRICGAIHVTKETAVLIRALKQLGAEVAWAGCNPLTTKDDVAAQLAREDVEIFAWRGNQEEYYWCLDEVIKKHPNLTMDDGADLVLKIHKDHRTLLRGVIGGTEETTTGVRRLRNMAREDELAYPIIAVNEAQTKLEFDNVYGTGQGTIDGLLRATSILVAGKNLVIAGYGHCGMGVARRARGMGANVIVTEVDPIRALKAVMDGFRVMPMKEAVRVGDVIITATGNKNIIAKEHFPLLKSGAILGNVGHFNVEIRVDQLDDYAVSKEKVKPWVTKYQLPSGKHVYLLAEGRLFNIAVAEGHPSSLMDLSFANQILSLMRLVKHHEEMENKVYNVPKSQDKRVARMKLEALGAKIDYLTREQIVYTKSWKEGT